MCQMCHMSNVYNMILYSDIGMLFPKQDEILNMHYTAPSRVWEEQAQYQSECLWFSLSDSKTDKCNYQLKHWYKKLINIILIYNNNKKYIYRLDC